MRLKYKIDANAFESLAENHKGLYEQVSDGSYILQVEGVVEKGKLDEFRNKNIDLMKDIEKFKDVDPDKYNQMIAEHRKIQEKEWIDKGEVEKLVESRVSTMKKDYDEKLTKATGDLNVMSRQLEILTIDNIVRDQATKLGVAPTAVDDVLLRAKTVYSLKDGKPVPTNSDGEVIYGKDGATPMVIGEWVGTLKESAPHLFYSSNGSGASGNRGVGGNSAGRQNMTAQEKISAGLQAGSDILS